MWFKMVFEGKVDENIIMMDAIKIPNKANEENINMNTPNTLAKAPNIFINTSPILFPIFSAPYFTWLPILS